MPLLEMQPERIMPLMVNQWASTITVGWTVWGPTQMLNFWFIPHRYWILTVNMVSIPWTCYMAYKNAHAQQKAVTHTPSVGASLTDGTTKTK